MKPYAPCLLGLAALAGASAQSKAATFTTQQIFLLGSPAVSATAINDKDAIAGTFAISGSHSISGFVLQPGAIWQINGMPSAINNAGAVTGVSFTDDTGFVWQNGTFTPQVTVPLGSFAGVPLTPVLNSHTKLAYSTSNSGQFPVGYAGQPGKTRPLRGLSPYTAIVNSINNSGVIAGYERIMLQGSETQAVFVGKAGLFDMLLSPTGGNVQGGLVNNSGAVAFSNGETGYVYTSHGITSFAMPVSTSSLQVQAISDTGRIVGVYGDTTQNPAVLRAFLYNGATVSVIGTYPGTDTVHVALNNRNTMVVSDTVPSQGTMQSFRIRCTGTAC